MSTPTDPSGSGPTRALTNRVIIVVDDDAAVRSLTAAYLRRYGAMVHQAESGSEAMSLIRALHASATTVHAVLCDFRMRGGSGMELHQQVSEFLPSLAARMIFFSGDTESDDVRAFASQHQVMVLAKPCPLTELRRHLAEISPLAET